jgi:hypothetical protein
VFPSPALRLAPPLGPRLSVGFHGYRSDQRRTKVITEADGLGKRVKVRSNEPGLHLGLGDQEAEVADQDREST